jgi:hypothetical protein
VVFDVELFCDYALLGFVAVSLSVLFVGFQGSGDCVWSWVLGRVGGGDWRGVSVGGP